MSKMMSQNSATQRLKRLCLRLRVSFLIPLAMSLYPSASVAGPILFVDRNDVSGMALTIQGSNFECFLCNITTTFGVSGAWSVSLTVIEQDPLGPLGVEDVRVFGTIQHVLGPHSNDGQGVPTSFDLSLPVLPQPVVSSSFNAQTTHPTNGHIDYFAGSLDGLVFNQYLNNTIIGRDVESYAFTLSASHTPEPSTWFLLTSGLACLVWWKYRRRRRNSALGPQPHCAHGNLHE